jgi:hypothetical protein
MDKAVAEAFADELDLERMPYCSACLCELAFIIADGRRPHPSTVGRIASWTWPDFEHELRVQVVELRMREVLHAEDALNDIEQRAFRGMLARVVVTRLAERMAEEIASGRESSS